MVLFTVLYAVMYTVMCTILQKELYTLCIQLYTLLYTAVHVDKQLANLTIPSVPVFNTIFVLNTILYIIIYKDFKVVSLFLLEPFLLHIQCIQHLTVHCTVLYTVHCVRNNVLL